MDATRVRKLAGLSRVEPYSVFQAIQGSTGTPLMVVNWRSATFIRCFRSHLSSDAPTQSWFQYNFMLKPTIFREYDIRGIADPAHPDFELTDPGVELLGQKPSAHTCNARTRVPRSTSSRDTRHSSPRLRGSSHAGA